ncbi:E3 ubiquitin-protein ligase TRIM45-like isoform X2 [Lineus longissimus]|uniref:E3 ubiquitin-protein ligase TRIM45-like isoform X2 n=1 Tax=Lineus longissimus TaxID=88925 RepID=UPI00315CB933
MDLDRPPVKSTERKPSPRPVSNMAKLADEIDREFLTCKICLDSYNNPKCLNCLHTFCEQCIENHVMSETTYKKYSDYRDFTCPLCRKRTQLPVGGVKKLPDNFLVSSLSEVIGREKPSKFPFCDICKLVNHKHREAASKCLDCNKLLCKPCIELHRETKVTKGHNIFDVEIEKDIECKEHEEEVVRFYCEPCETCICVLCTFNEHKDHDISSFNDAVIKYKENIENLLRNCQTKIQDYQAEMNTVAACGELIKDTENKIKEVAAEFMSQIKSREKILLEEVRNIFGPETVNLIENRDEMAANLDGLKSTCSLTDIILKGKDIELLLLKKQVSDKLSTLSDIQVTTLPASVNKKIKYVPGSLDMGYVMDMDRPLLTRFRSTRPSLPNLSGVDLIESPELVTTESVGTQTDPVDAMKSTEPPDMTEISVQANMIEEKPILYEKGCGTDTVETEEKAVNTRSRQSSITTGTSGTSTRRSEVNAADSGENTPASPSSNRRRRRRERNKTQDYSTLIDDQPPTIPNNSYSTSNNAYGAEPDSGRRQRRSRFLYGSGSGCVI